MVKLTKWIPHGYSPVGCTMVANGKGRTLRETGRLEGSIKKDLQRTFIFAIFVSKSMIP